jgi:hypothetical protein
MTHIPECALETISADKVNEVLQWIIANTAGPREGYVVLCCAIYTLNDIMDEPASVDRLADEVAHSIRTMFLGRSQ